MDTAEKERLLADGATASDAPCWYDNAEACAWANGYNDAADAMAEAERRAFERGRAAGREEAAKGPLESVLAEFERRTELVPIGHENKRRGASTYGWRLAHAKEMREIAAAPTPPLSKREGAERKPCTCSDETIARVNAGDICGMGGCPYGGDL